MGVPKWLQSVANATIRASIADSPAVATASGYRINSKTGEVTQDATDDPGVKQLRDNLAVLGGTATGITATPVVGAVVSNPVAQKLIGDAAASMLGGEVVDKTHRALTGQSFGRGVASIFGQQNVYDRSALARFGYDALNPGYFAGNLVAKGTNAAIDAAGKALKSADNYVTIQNALRTGKLRFGEPTTYTGIHQSKTPLTKVQFPYQRWDVTTHGADPNGFWLTLADSPNTTGTMASRPYASRWSATSQKPLIQTGEVKNLLGKKNNTRNAIVKYGRKHGADAFEFRGIADNRLPQTDVVMITEGTNPQYLGGVGQVRYAGPTTGKSTFIKANPDSGLVDLDAIPGYKQLRKDIAEQLGLDWKSPKVTDSPEYQQAFNDFIRDWAQNTENTGKTLFGSAKGLLRGDNPLTGQPFIPDFETFVARNQARGFRENPEQLRAWYNSIVDSYPEIKIDNRFIGEIPFYNAPKTSVRSIQMEEPIMSSSKGLTEAEKLGIPKGLRSNPKALEDPYYWGYQQWNSRYNAAVNSGNLQEAQRLRDLHFKQKALDTQMTGTYYRSERGEKPWYVFDIDRMGTNGTRMGKGIYFFNDAKAVKNYGNDVREFFINSKNLVEDVPGPKLFGYPNEFINKMKNNKVPSLRKAAEHVDGADTIHGIDVSWGKPLDEWAVKSPNQIKLVDPITRTDMGETIPIVKRDNFHNPDIRYKQGGKIKPVLKAQPGNVIGVSPIPKLIPKKLFELVAKRSNGAQTKSIPTIIGDVLTGRDKSFYNENNINGSNEIDTYLYGKPYNSEFTGDASAGPDYTKYVNKNYPNRNIKTYNAHFGDTLYIDNKAKSLVEKQLNNGEVVGGSMGRYAHAPSYIVTKEEGRPYDAGGHLMKFGRDKNGNIVANMSDIYDFLPEDFNDKYNQTENPSWTRNLANNIGTPFIVRQNNIPVRFKEIVPEYKTDKQRQLGDFLSQWGDMYDLKLPLRLTDSQIDEIFDGRDYGDDILDFMISKGYINPQQ